MTFNEFLNEKPDATQKPEKKAEWRCNSCQHPMKVKYLPKSQVTVTCVFDLRCECGGCHEVI